MSSTRSSSFSGGRHARHRRRGRLARLRFRFGEREAVLALGRARQRRLVLHAGAGDAAERERRHFGWPGTRAAVRVRQRAACEGDANGLAGGRGGGLDREPHHHCHLLVAAELGLRRNLQLDAADARPRQHAHRLDPEAVEVLLFVAEPPAPGVVEPEEQHRTRAGERLEDKRVLLAGGAAFGGAVRVNGEHDRVGFSSVAGRVPVQRLQPVPDGRGLGLVRREAEERVLPAGGRDSRPEPIA